MSPLAGFFAAVRAYQRPDNSWQYFGRVFPADERQQLERLVHEVHDMPGVAHDAVGGGAYQQVGHFPRRRAIGNRGEQAALGAVAVAHEGPMPHPAFE